MAENLLVNSEEKLASQRDSEPATRNTFTHKHSLVKLVVVSSVVLSS